MFISPTAGEFGPLGKIILALACLGALAYSIVRVRKLYQMMLVAGKDPSRFDDLKGRFGDVAATVLSQRTVLRDPLPGISHFLVFWGFIIITVGTINLIAVGFSARLNFLSVIPAFAWVIDTFAVLVFLAVLTFGVRRYILRPPQLGQSTDAGIILGAIQLLMLTLFFAEGFANAAGGSSGPLYSPLGALLAPALSGLGRDADILGFRIFYWAHILTVLAFGMYIPSSKHLHLLATPFNVFFRRHTPMGALQLIPNIEAAETYGVSKVEQFTWKDLLDTYSCTECGRCDAVCPALQTDKPLSPKHIVLDIKADLFAKADLLLASKKSREEAAAGGVKLVGGLIKDEALWACTTCGACVEVCPVTIEQLPKIVDMRRSLVMEESSFPPEVTPLFTNLERNGNPWEIGNATRADWAKELNVPLLANKPDAELLYWVGCMGSYDQRNRKVATAFVHILQEAKVDFAILGPEEKCNGDPARRIGNEYLWQMLAQENIETLKTYAVKTIVTACPHCFNTLKNEYPQLGGTYHVLHHSEFINELIAKGQLRLPTGSDQRQMTYHDPCYLGRHNTVYDAPRDVISLVNTQSIIEMPRNRNKSFCCGGGGGRAWMEEKIGKRINQTRVKEAVETKAEVLAAGCPFCITMFEDGIKGVNVQDHMRVEDIAEIIDRALQSAKTTSTPLPDSN